MKDAEDRELLRFAEKILALLNQGQFVATYKYAVLLGLIDLCMEGVSKSGTPPTSVTTRQLAEKTIELYWPHAVAYPGSDEVLRQNTGRQGTQARIVTLISRFRRTTSFVSLPRARLRYHSRYETLVKQVEWKLIEMPLPRVQVVGDREDRFVYDISWQRDEILGNAKAFKREVTAYQRGERSSFDNRIRLRPGAAESLLALNSLLRPFIQTAWAAKVAQINQLEESRLTDFLFDPDRTALTPLRPGLIELQSGCCFYCAKRLKGEIDIDHFIPWSRYPDNRIDNLVAAHSKCNRHKLDFLAADRHIERWRTRSENTVLTELAEEQTWERDLGATVGVARSIYLGLPDGSPLWVEDTQFEDSARPALELVLS